MAADRFGILCVVVSLLLHGVVGVVTLARSVGPSPQSATVYQVVLASSPASAGSSLHKPQSSKKLGVPDPSPPVTIVREKPTAVSPVAQPVVPTVAVPTPVVTSQLAASASPAPAASLVGRATSALPEAGHGGPVLPLGSAGAPAFSRQVAPVYPAQARRLGREGTVVLKLVIDAEGRLQGVEVVQAASFGFTEAAVNAIRQSSYRPAVAAGRPVQAQALITIRFTLRS